MRVKIPDDWDNSTYELIGLVIPASIQWRGVVKGAIAELDNDYAWDEGDDSDVDAALAEITEILWTIGPITEIDGGGA